VPDLSVLLAAGAALAAGPFVVRAAARTAAGYRHDGRRTAPTTTGLVAGAVLLAAAWAGAVALAGVRPVTVGLAVAAAAALLLAAVDLGVHRLPDRVTYPAAVLVLLAELADALALGTWPELGRALLAAAAAFGVAALAAAVSPEGLGFGDVKLLALIGLVLGWWGWPVLVLGVFLGLVLGALMSLGLVLLRRAGWRSAVPFGPPLLLGAALALALAEGYAPAW
jgi:leader peptidase (prepilin peptidase) / N-methyltransferase